MSNYDDEPDETLMERIVGLTEIFPQSVRNAGGVVFTKIGRLFKKSYQATCNITWILLSSTIILFAPVVFELERTQIRQLQCAQQKELLLGTPGMCVGKASPQLR